MADEGYIFEQRTAERIVGATRREERRSRYLESADYGSPMADGGTLYKITGAAGGGGKFNGRTVTGNTTAVATGNLAMPEGMTVAAADDCLILQMSEDGLATHDLAIGSFVTGEVIGQTADDPPKLIVATRAGSGGGTVPAGTLFAVDLSNPSAASDGSATTACAITYDVADKAGTALLTGAAPECVRGVGLRSAAVAGTAYYDVDHNPVLFWANEPEGASLPTCPPA